MSEQDDNHSNPVINELLCYMVSKIGLLDIETLIQLCESAFDANMIDQSKDQLFDLCHNEDCTTERKGRKGEHKSDRNLRDIYNLLQDKGDAVPKFVAHDLNMLPPVTFKSIDVSSLLQTIKSLQIEVKQLREGVELQRQTSQDTYDITKSLDTRVNYLEKQSITDIKDQILHTVCENISKFDKRINTLEGKAGENSQDNISLQSHDSEDLEIINDDRRPVLRLRGPSDQELDPQAAPYVGIQAAPPKVTQPSFASMAKRQMTNGLQNDYVIDEDGFVLVGGDGKPVKAKQVKPVVQYPPQQRPTNFRNVGVVGNSLRPGGPVAARRIVKANVFATRYHPDTTIDEVTNYILSDNRLKNHNVTVEKLATKYDTYASFHVTCVCLESLANEFLNPNLWPSGILVRKWKEKRVQREDNHNYGNHGRF